MDRDRIDGSAVGEIGSGGINGRQLKTAVGFNALLCGKKG
jgi:hypothetical protein